MATHSKQGRPRKKPLEQKSDDSSPSSYNPSPSTSDEPRKARPMRQKRVASLTCEICDKILHSVAALHRHRNIHTGERPYACGSCGEQFKRVEELHRHEVQHEGEDNYCCHICKIEVEDQDSLVKHMKSHSIDIIPHVSSAGYTFRSSAVVKQYQELFSSGQNLPCYVCFEENPSPEHLLNHLAIHTALELLKGSTDRKLWKTCISYAQVEYAKWRMRQSKAKPNKSSNIKFEQDEVSEFTHVCRVCHQMFKGVEMVVDHWLQKKGRRGHEGFIGEEGHDAYIFRITMDNGKPSLTCDPCQKALNSASEAAAHFENCHKVSEIEEPVAKKPKIQEEESVPIDDADGVIKEEHMDETGDAEELMIQQSDESDESDVEVEKTASGKVICPVCNKTLDNSKLLRHHFSVHQGEKAFVCPACGKKYSRPEDLKQHIIRHIAQMYSKGNTTDNDSEFKCGICSEMFQCEKDLQFHGVFHGVFRPGSKKYVEGQSTVCPICGKVLQKATSLISHIKLHNTGKDFPCKTCGKGFRSERNKERHEKIHTGVKEFQCETCGKGLSRKAEYLAHISRHETDPTFNGKAGRKRGTKVVNSKVMFAKDIYKPQDDKDSKPRTYSAQKQTILMQQEANEELMFYPADTITSTQRQTVVYYPEKMIIPYKKKRKMHYEVVMIDDTATSLLTSETLPSQSVETQTDSVATEQSLAHNIEIIDSELRDGFEEETLLVAPELVTEGEGDTEGEEVIIIVQDPTTGENEVLTIQSFQEGASKLISPNEDILKALESFQKNKNLNEIVTVQSEEEKDVANIQIKTEPMEIEADLIQQPSTEVIPDLADVVETLTNKDVKSEDVDDQFNVSTEDSQQAGTPAPPSILHNSASNSVISVNKNVKVVSFTLDENTGVLVPVYPHDATPMTAVDQAISVTMDVVDTALVDTQDVHGDKNHALTMADTEPIESDPGLVKSVEDHLIGETSVDSVPVLMNTDGDMTAVEALMQMKSPEHHRLQAHIDVFASDQLDYRSQVKPLVSSVGSVEHVVPVSSLKKSTDTSSQAIHGATLLKEISHGRDLEDKDQICTELKTSAINSSSPTKTSPEKVKVLPLHSESPANSEVTGDVSETGVEDNDGKEGNEDNDYVPDDDSDGLDNEPEERPKPRRQRKTKREVPPIQAVRKSLRKNSYEGVSKIVASLIRPKRKSGEKVSRNKLDPEKIAEESVVKESVTNESEDESSNVQVTYCQPDFVKCNICKVFLDHDKLRQHVDMKHGMKAYKCGLCDQSYDTDVDLHMHLLGHDKADRIKKTLSLFSEDMEVTKQQLETGGKSVLSGAASVAILALERGGDLQEALATVDVDVDQMLNTETETDGRHPDKSSIDSSAKSPKEKFKEDTILRRSSPRIRANLRTQQRTDNTSNCPSESVPDTDGDVSSKTGDCAACRDSFLSSFQLQNQDLDSDFRKEHTCGKLVRGEGDPEDEDAGDVKDKADSQLYCVCGLCGYRFVNVNLLSRHVRAHYQEKPFECNLCHKKFGRRDELSKHKLIHQKNVERAKQVRRKFLPRLKNGKYPCHLCKDVFKTYQYRYTHVLCHEHSETGSQEKTSVPEKQGTSQKPVGDISQVDCDVCGLVLSGPRHLQRHKLVHSGERSWLCQDCGKSFLRNDDLRVHRRRQHPQDAPASEETRKSTFQKNCPFCKKNFTSFVSFRNHVKTHKSEKLDGSLKCDICGKIFIKHISLRNHQQKHKDTYRRGMKRNVSVGGTATTEIYHCEKCGKQIKNKSNFIRHMKLHNDGKDHFCSTCSKGFARGADLKMHERLHTGERPFLCNICGKGFPSNSALGHHVKLHNQPVVYKFSCTQCECLFSSRKEFRAHVKTCTPKTMEIVFIEDMEAVPIETILGQSLEN